MSDDLYNEPAPDCVLTRKQVFELRMANPDAFINCRTGEVSVYPQTATVAQPEPAYVLDTETILVGVLFALVIFLIVAACIGVRYALDRTLRKRKLRRQIGMAMHKAHTA